MRTLLIDDMREIEADVIARTFEAGIKALKLLGPFETLYLDHDLGEVDETSGSESWVTVDGQKLPMNGYGIMCFLEANPHLLPEKITIVSSNPVGRKNMQIVIDKLYGDKI
jgi:hypothetical protein